MPDLDFTNDDQDQSELFDEDNYDASSGGVSNERRTFEELPDVLDVTRAAGDEDDDEALIGEDLDDDEIIQLELDADDADFEDDDLADRDPESLREDVGNRDVETRHASDEVELVDAGDMSDVNVRQQRDLTAMESSDLDDDELEALGYSERGPDGTMHAKD